MRGVETEWRDAWWRHEGWETRFAGPGGNFANPEVRRSILRGSWRFSPQTNQCEEHSVSSIWNQTCFGLQFNILLNLRFVYSILFHSKCICQQKSIPEKGSKIMLNKSNCDRMSQLSGILAEPLNTRALHPLPRLSQENEENVARTRNCCGWPSSPLCTSPI